MAGGESRNTPPPVFLYPRHREEITPWTCKAWSFSWLSAPSPAGWPDHEGGGFGLLGNIVVGIIGAVVGGFLFGLLGLSAGGLIGSIVTATAGAVVQLFLIGLIKKA